ncbi:hypothetical protein EZV62_007303 [Acer yangbiense]|uniref:Uncharacterized protein n=1 Tax=Acer yangbiense TaxID=1000413 RepID=A0A5C7IA71_9ROSI|nr:hypothetical protein EZV62_007303 [Acer yangbiense]
MALSLSNAFHSPKPRISLRNCNLKTPVSSFQSSNVSCKVLKVIICAAASAAGSSNQDSELNPYEVLGVSPIEGFDMVKASYTKKRKEAERNNDEAIVARVEPEIVLTLRILRYVIVSQLEKAYGKLMMQQLIKWKKGVTFGFVKVHMGVASVRSIFASQIGITEAPYERNKPYRTPVSFLS